MRALSLSGETPRIVSLSQSLHPKKILAKEKPLPFSVRKTEMKEHILRAMSLYFYLLKPSGDVPGLPCLVEVDYTLLEPTCSWGKGHTPLHLQAESCDAPSLLGFGHLPQPLSLQLDLRRLGGEIKGLLSLACKANPSYHASQSIVPLFFQVSTGVGFIFTVFHDPFSR